MALWRRSVVDDYLTASEESLPEPKSEAVAVAPSGLGLSSILGFGDGYVTRDTAMSVPAFRRAVNLVGTTLGQMHLRQETADRRTITPAPLLRQIDPKRTLAAVLTDVYTDLALWGAAYLYNPRWNREDGWRFAGSSKRKHRSLEVVHPEDVAEVRRNGYTIYRYDARGVSHPVDVPVDAVVAFEAAAGHWLRDGASSINTALLLEQAVRLYAQTPIPTTILKNTGPRKTPKQVEELLAIVEESRRKRSTAYVGRDLELDSFGFDANQIALVDARAQAILDIARLTGIPALYLSQGINGSSTYYSNLTQQRIDLHSALQPFATAVEQRLSFDDITGEGSFVLVDFGPFLRIDPLMRAELYSKLIPLGVMTRDEARAFEALTPADELDRPDDPSGGTEGRNRTGTDAGSTGGGGSTGNPRSE